MDPFFPELLFCATCPWSRTEFLGYESWDTQPNSVDSFNKATNPFAPPFFDFLLDSPQPQHVWRNLFFQICIQSQTWQFWHTGGCQNSRDGFFLKKNNFCNGMEFRSFCLKSFHLVLPDVLADFSLPSSVLAFELGAGEDDRPFRLWPPY